MPSSAPLAFITGATGLVGANLAAVLHRQGWRLRVLRRATSPMEALEGIPYEEVEADLLDAGALRRAMAGCDALFHVAGAAGHWHTHPDVLYRVNVEGTRQVMQAALAAGIRRVVHTSSVAALGLPRPGHILTEADEFDDDPKVFPYGHSKYLAEQEVQKAIRQGLDAVIVNPSAVLGPRDVHLGSATLILQWRRRSLPFITGGGLNYVDAEDAARGHLAAAEQGRTGERYILGGENISHLAMAQLLADLLGTRPPRRVLSRRWAYFLAWLLDVLRPLLPKDSPLNGNLVRLSTEKVYVSTEKAQRELGLPPPTPLRETLLRTIAWLRDKGLLAQASRSTGLSDKGGV